MTIDGNTVAGYLSGEHDFSEIDETEFTDPMMKDFSFEDGTLVYDMTEGSETLNSVDNTSQIFEADEAADYLGDRLWDTVKAVEASVSRYEQGEFRLETVTESGRSSFESREIFSEEGYGDTFMAEIADEFIEAVQNHGYQEIASSLPRYE